MTADLNRLGLQPDPDHPDAKLLHRLHAESARQEAWEACKTDGDRRRWLLAVADQGDDFLKKQASLAKESPSTLLGLLAKADLALHTWRELKGERHSSMWGMPCTALEQAVEILGKMTEEEVQAILARQS